jgi:CRISPR-associated exonuclease Cas4
MAEGAGGFVSAGDLEKYSYCPLNWLLSRQHEPEREDLSKGIEEHDKFGRSLWEIDTKERTARQSETLVFWYAVTATVIAVLGLEMVVSTEDVPIGEIMGAVALIWILAAAFFLYKASRSNISSKVMDYEKTILIFAIVAVVLAVNAVAFLMKDDKLAQALEMVSLLWLIGASFFLYRSLKSTEVAESLRHEYKVKGKIEYIDIDDSKVFRSAKHGISGRPDYIMRVGEKTIPVEVKKGRTPRGPLFSHIVQVAAYCLLLEETTGRAPPYGVIKYPEAEHDIEYNEDIKRMVLEKAKEIRAAEETKEAHRNHNRPGKCRSCSRRAVCPERLA